MTDIQEYTRLNDSVFSATSCSWKIALAPFVGIKQVGYAETRERKDVEASNRGVGSLNMTGGRYKVGDIGLTMLMGSWMALLDILTPLGAGSYGDARFPFVGKYFEPLSMSRPIVVDIQGCAVVSVQEDIALDGVDELVAQIGLKASRLTRNGHRLWSVANGVIT